MSVLKQKAITSIRNNSGVVNECALTNIRRTYYLSIIGVLVRILNISFFTWGNTELDTWDKGIIISHVSLLIVFIVFLIVSYRRRKNTKADTFMVGFQYVVVAVIMLSGIIITAIDQLVTTNITPFIMVCIVTGTVFLIRPLISALIFLTAYIIYYYAIAITIINDQMLLSNRVNGITIVSIGFIISVMLWHYNYINIIQKRHIEAQRKQLEQMAYYDPLTKIYNRHFFTKSIEEEFKLVKRYNHESAIIFLDIDDFKKLNDSYGHLVGDQVLMEVAGLILANIRETDTLARFGGEEFIILAPQTSLSGGIELAEKIRKLIEKNPFEVGREKSYITASFGVALLEKVEEHGTEYSLDQVDKALYLAKGKGKNRVETV